MAASYACLPACSVWARPRHRALLPWPAKPARIPADLPACPSISPSSQLLHLQLTGTLPPRLLEAHSGLEVLKVRVRTGWAEGRRCLHPAPSAPASGTASLHSTHALERPPSFAPLACAAGWKQAFWHGARRVGLGTTGERRCPACNIVARAASVAQCRVPVSAPPAPLLLPGLALHALPSWLSMPASRALPPLPDACSCQC